MGALDVIITLLVIFWIGGFLLHVAGGAIHLLLVIALVLLVVRLLQRTV